MSALLVPTPRDGYPDTSVRVALDGVTYSLRWLWNQRTGYWAFSIADANGDAIRDGVRVALNVDLLEGNADPRRPAGQLFVLDPSGGKADPGLNDLGNRVKVVYFLPEEAA